MMNTVTMPLRRDAASLTATEQLLAAADADAGLVSQLRDGEEQAFETFVQRYRVRLLAIAGQAQVPALLLPALLNLVARHLDRVLKVASCACSHRGPNLCHTNCRQPA